MNTQRNINMLSTLATAYHFLHMAMGDLGYHPATPDVWGAPPTRYVKA